MNFFPDPAGMLLARRTSNSPFGGAENAPWLGSSLFPASAAWRLLVGGFHVVGCVTVDAGRVEHCNV